MIACPKFYRTLLATMRAVLAAERPGYTGCVVIKVHCKNQNPESVSVEFPETPRRFADLIAD